MRLPSPPTTATATVPPPPPRVRGAVPRPGTLRPLRPRIRALNDDQYFHDLLSHLLGDDLPPAAGDLSTAMGAGVPGGAPGGSFGPCGPVAVTDHHLELSDGGGNEPLRKRARTELSDGGGDEPPCKRGRTAGPSQPSKGPSKPSKPSNRMGRPSDFRRGLVRSLYNLDGLSGGFEQPGNNLLYNNLRQGEFADLARRLHDAGVALNTDYYMGRPGARGKRRHFPRGVDVEDAVRETVEVVRVALGHPRLVLPVRLAWSEWRLWVVARRGA